MVKDNEKTRKFPIRVDLDKEDAKKFETIQKKFKLKNKADVLRFCVNKVYHGVALEIDEDLYNEIHKIITSPQIKIRYAITSVDDFIKRAISAKVPLRGTMDLEYNLAWPGPQDVIPDWVGTIDIDGELYGMAFFAIGTGKPFEDDRPGSAYFFGEIYEIYETLEFKFVDGILTCFNPGAIVLKGTDEGSTNLKNSHYRMNGVVTETNEDFAKWLGRSVHMSGTIIWTDFGAPQNAPGTFRIN